MRGDVISSKAQLSFIFALAFICKCPISKRNVPQIIVWIMMHVKRNLLAYFSVILIAFVLDLNMSFAENKGSLVGMETYFKKNS